MTTEELIRKCIAEILYDPCYGGYPERKQIGCNILQRALDHSRGYDVSYPGWSTNVFDHLFY